MIDERECCCSIRVTIHNQPLDNRLYVFFLTLLITSVIYRTFTRQIAIVMRCKSGQFPITTFEMWNESSIRLCFYIIRWMIFTAFYKTQTKPTKTPIKLQIKSKFELKKVPSWFEIVRSFEMSTGFCVYECTFCSHSR